MTTDIARVGVGDEITTVVRGATASPLKPGTKTRLMNRVVNVYTEPSCKTCSHPQRPWIEMVALSGWSGAAIYRALMRDDEAEEPTSDDVISARSIKRHFQKGHAPKHTLTVYAALLAKANELGVTYETYAGKLMDVNLFAGVMIQHVIEKFMAGDMPEVEWRDFKDFVAIQRDQQAAIASTGLDDMDEVDASFSIVLEKVRSIMTPEQFHEFAAVLSQYPTVKGLKTRNDLQERKLREEIKAEVRAELSAGA